MIFPHLKFSKKEERARIRCAWSFQDSIYDQVIHVVDWLKKSQTITWKYIERTAKSKRRMSIFRNFPSPFFEPFFEKCKGILVYGPGVKKHIQIAAWKLQRTTWNWQLWARNFQVDTCISVWRNARKRFNNLSRHVNKTFHQSPYCHQ